MAKDQVTKRTARQAAIVIDDAGEAPANAAPTIAPVGTAVPAEAAPASAVPSAVVVPPTGTSAAEAAAHVSDAIAVPATPTEAQVQARIMIGNVRADWAKYFALCPSEAQAFVEPDKAALTVRRQAYMTAQGMDLTDMDQNIAAAFHIKSLVDAEKAAHEAKMGDVNAIKLEWLRASRTELLDVIASIETMISAAGGKVKASKPASGENKKPSAMKGGNKELWAKRGKALNDYAEKIGLAGVYWVDMTQGGYRGKYHALRLHPDGTFTKVDYNPQTHAVKDTGVSVPTWKYFTTDGEDRTEDTPADMIPKYSLSNDAMHGVLMLGKDGKLMDIPGLTCDRVDAQGKRIAGSLKHYALMSIFFAAAGMPL